MAAAAAASICVGASDAFATFWVQFTAPPTTAPLTVAKQKAEMFPYELSEMPQVLQMLAFISNLKVRG